MRSGWRDDTGSLPLAMLLALVGVSLSALLVPLVLTQIGATRAGAQRAHALHAAQAGLDVALGQIRAARDGAGNGVPASLPCGPLTGRVGAAGTARYHVTIDYLAADPQGQPDTWVATNRITCAAGSGPASTPRYALLRSRGTDEPNGPVTDAPGRDLRATYTLQIVNQNVTGGLIRAYGAGGGSDLCLDAGATAPAAGANVQLRSCTSASSRQLFAYQANLTLVLVASRTPTRPLGMCLDAGALPHAADRPVQFQPCTTTTSPQQQWIFNGSGNFAGTTDGTTPDGFCFTVQTPDTLDSFVVLGTACLGSYDSARTFVPEAAVGAGAAGAGADQLVNVNQFARCLEVAEQDVDYGYLIAGPCTQAPSGAGVAWSQQWALPAVATGSSSGTGAITTTHPSTGPHCLRSPAATASGQYVTVVACPGGVPPLDLTWTVHADTGNYATGYRIVDGFGYCLAPTDPNAVPADLHPVGQQTSKLVVAACDGSTAQKWNAPPHVLRSLPLRDIGER